MVWKQALNPTYEREKFLAKNAITVRAKPLFYHAHTRKSKELNQQENCKITVEKKLSLSQREFYDQEFKEQRLKDNPPRARPRRNKYKRDVVTIE